MYLDSITMFDIPSNVSIIVAMNWTPTIIERQPSDLSILKEFS